MFRTGDAVAQGRVDLLQRGAGLIAPGEVFASVAVPARTLDQITDFKIKAVIRAAGGRMFSCFPLISIAAVTGTIFCMIISVPRCHESYISSLRVYNTPFFSRQRVKAGKIGT